MDEKGRWMREYSMYYIGEKTREDLLSISDESEADGSLELNFVLYKFEDSKELRAKSVSTADRPISGAKAAHSDNKKEIPKGTKFIAFGHSHTNKGAIAKHGTTKLSVLKFTAPTSKYLALIDLDRLDRDLPRDLAGLQFIVSPVGYRIYSSVYISITGAFVAPTPNFGQGYLYNGEMVGDDSFENQSRR